jgi:hypothetical protein
MVGGLGVTGGAGAAVTVIVKAFRLALAEPSLTVMAMLAKVPTSALFGVPLSSPVLVLKAAHEGLLSIE